MFLSYFFLSCLKSEGLIILKELALYDESCSLCQVSKKRVMALDWLKRVNWVSLQEYEKKANNHYLNKKELRTQLHLITANGEILKGFYAIRKIMLQCPLLMIPGVICYMPFVDLFGNRVYRWVAKNRQIFLGKSCDDGNCSL